MNGKLRFHDAATLRVRRTAQVESTGWLVTFPTFTPDGKTLLVVNGKRVDRLNPVTGEEQGEPLLGHTAFIYSLAVSADGQALWSASGDLTVRRWDLARGRQIERHAGPPGSDVNTVCVSPDSRLAAWALRDHSVQVWDVAADRLVCTLKGHTAEVDRVAFTPDGRLVATAANNGIIKVWDSATGQHKHDVVLGQTGDWPCRVAISPDGRSFAVAAGNVGKGGEVASWLAPPVAQGPDVTATPARVFQGHARAIRAVAFAPDGKRAVVAPDASRLKVWEVATGAAVADLAWAPRRWAGWVSTIAFTPDGRWFLSCGDEGPRLWDTGTLHEVRRFEPCPVATLAASLSPDGRRLLTCHGDRLYLWDVASGKREKELTSPAGAGSSAAFGPPGRVLSNGGDGPLLLWDLAQGKVVQTLKGHDNTPTAVLCSPDGSRALSRRDDMLIYWDLQAPKRLGELQCRDAFGPLAFSPDGHFAVSGHGDGSVRLWDLKTLQQIHRFQGHAGEVHCVAFSPDGRQVLSGGVDTTLRLWQLPAAVGP
jgi:WD40 repeat protein